MFTMFPFCLFPESLTLTEVLGFKNKFLFVSYQFEPPRVVLLAKFSVSQTSIMYLLFTGFCCDVVNNKFEGF